MPIRMIRDWTGSDKVNSLTANAERFFVRLIMKVDDYGCFYADTRLLKANLFPLLLDSIREADMLRWMTECQKAGLIVLYESDSKKYLQIVDFRQRLDKARSKFPLPTSTDFPETVNEFPEVENEVRSETENETETEKEEREAAKPPTLSPFEIKKKEFGLSLKPYLSTYGKEMIRQFFDYWREPNKSGKKMRWEQERTWDIELRLKRWAQNDKEFKGKKSVENAGPPTGPTIPILP